MEKLKQIKGWWIRNGNEGFLISNVYMNKENAELVCKGRNLKRDYQFNGSYKVIPVLITPIQDKNRQIIIKGSQLSVSNSKSLLGTSKMVIKKGKNF